MPPGQVNEEIFDSLIDDLEVGCDALLSKLEKHTKEVGEA